MKILFIGKSNDFYCQQALNYLKMHSEVTSFLGSWGDKLPEDIWWWKGHWIISYLSRWIIPKNIIRGASKGAINFHPGPPEYPGIGCTNFAIYDGNDKFGATCHYIAPKVDTGAIIKVENFDILKSDTVYSLTQKTYAHMLSMFYEIVDNILDGNMQHGESHSWSGKPTTRKDLDELCRVTRDMSTTEIKRRIKATTYPGFPGAYIMMEDERFEHKGGIKR